MRGQQLAIKHPRFLFHILVNNCFLQKAMPTATFISTSVIKGRDEELASTSAICDVQIRQGQGDLH